ncbi:MAG: 2-oxo acid dehydrogenase subunit E2 [Proteobacteria bacterium]|nr:2-oxo acid dehydrogenase subunit E2 [Pseudomonadota bacterium]
MLTELRALDQQVVGTGSLLLRWLKQVGAPVGLDEPLLEIETDKVTVEICSPIAGTLHEILKEPESSVATGDLLARIDSSEVKAPVSATGTSVAPLPAQPQAPPLRTRGLSPAVRRLLSEHHLEPAEVSGTGLGGRLTATDVVAYLRQRPVYEAPEDEMRLVPHTPMRRRIAAHMVESLLRVAPHVTTVFEADLGAVLKHRERHRADFERRGVPLTLTAYFACACVDAIRAVPEVNARWTDTATEIYRSLHLGIAMALAERGLLVPVVRDVDMLTLSEFAARLAALTARARGGKLVPSDVQGGTFTISNHGVSGSLVAAPIVIHQPQAAILGIGRVQKRVVVIEHEGVDSIAIRPRCYVSLTIDHRVLDGERANLFLATLVKRLESWSD